MKKSALFFSLVILAMCPAFRGSSQLTIDNSVNATDGVQNVLLGTGVTANNITFMGNNEQIGAFTCNGCGLGIGNGLVIGTGNVTGTVGPNNNGSYSLGQPSGSDGVSDVDLAELSGMSLNNTAVLEFDFVPTGDSLAFNYVFGSEEYPEYVNSINDAFGFFLSGPGLSGPYSNSAENIALIPNSSTPISINTVNGSVNSAYYVDNQFSAANVQPDGFTTVLTAFAEVICGETYHIKITIGDASDGGWDSWVFLEAGSFQSNQIAIAYTQPNIAPANGGVYEGCDTAYLTFTRGSGQTDEQTFDLDFSGTAINGVDYELLAQELIFPEGEISVSIPITAIPDGTLEGAEAFTITLNGVEGCNGGNGTSIDLSISDLPALQINMPDVMINCGEQAILTPQVSGGLGNYLIEWENGDEGPSLSVYPDAPVSYNFTVSDTCGVTPVDAVANVVFETNPAIVVNLGADITATCLDQINIVPLVSGGFGSYDYAWSANGVLLSTATDVSFYDTEDQTIELVVTDDCGDTGDDIVEVIYPPTPIDLDLGNDVQVTCIDETLIEPQISGGVGTYSYLWSTQAGNLGAASELLFQTEETTEVVLEVEDECGNTASDNITFSVPQVAMNLDLGADLTVQCIDVIDMQADASGGVGNYSYSWFVNGTADGNQSSESFQFDEDSEVELIVEDECGNSTTDVVNVSVPPVPVLVDAGEDLSVTCLDNSPLDASVEGGVGNYSYSWNDGDGVFSSNASPSYTAADDVVITLTVEDECGNSASDQLSISVPPVPVTVDAGPDLSVTCLDSSPLSANVQGGVGDYSYEWSDPSGPFSSSANTQYTAPENVTITVTVEDECGNTQSDHLLIQVPPVPIDVSTSADTAVCIGEWVYMSAAAEGGIGTLTYNWAGMAYEGEALDIVPETSTTFIVNVHDQCGNQSSAPIHVTIYDVHPSFSAEYVGDFTIAFTNLTPDAAYIEWLFSDGTTSLEENPVHEFLSTDNWSATLTGYAPEGCAKSVSQEYEPLGNLFIPNTFTPDNDGINDVLFVKGHDLQSFEIFIYDRWGDEVFYSNDITKPWDGSVKDGEFYAPDGVYTYRIVALGDRDNLIEKRGSITILR